MRKIWLTMMLLLVASFGLAAWIEPWFQIWIGSRTDSANLLAVILGDSRRLFAKHVYAKADAYFHNGYYPSIFDQIQTNQANYLHQQSGLQAQGDSRCAGPTEALDWLDRFSRYFYPSQHAHLGESVCTHPDHDHDHDQDHPESQGRAAGLEREILPWLKASAGLDPHRAETYVITAYWLRKELGKTNEAEQFLREGLRANPRNPEILFELGRIYFEDRHQPSWARNLWELALRSWETEQAHQPQPNLFLYAQILGNLGRLEEGEGNWAEAIAHLTQLAEISPNKDRILQWIHNLRAKQRHPGSVSSPSNRETP